MADAHMSGAHVTFAQPPSRSPKPCLPDEQGMAVIDEETGEDVLDDSDGMEEFEESDDEDMASDSSSSSSDDDDDDPMAPAVCNAAWKI